jgi:hypothetical protein
VDQLQPVAGDLVGVPTLPHYNIHWINGYPIQSVDILIQIH